LFKIINGKNKNKIFKKNLIKSVDPQIKIENDSDQSGVMKQFFFNSNNDNFTTCKGFEIKNLSYLIYNNEITINEKLLTKKIQNDNIYSLKCSNKIFHPKLNLCKECFKLRNKLIYYATKIEEKIKTGDFDNILKIKNIELLNYQNKFLKKNLKEKIKIDVEKKNIEKNLKKIENQQKLEFINLFISVINNGLEKNSFFYHYLNNVFNNIKNKRNNNNNWSQEIINYSKVLRLIFN
jgi:hypothetical protein